MTLRHISKIATDLSRRCPQCGKEVQAMAIVDSWEPDAWAFYGPGHPRFIVCQSATFVHFRVVARGRDQHRLAYIRPGAVTQ